MALFFIFLSMGDRLGLGEWEYPFRCVVLAAALWFWSRRVIDLRVTSWLPSIVIGAAVFAIWIAPDLLWPPVDGGGYRSHWLFQNGVTGTVSSSVPESYRNSVMVLVSRAVRAAILVPVIEELFWRAWMMRWLIRDDFEKVPLGTYARQAFWITAILFAVEHGPFWDVGLIAGVIYNGWMVRTRSLGDCVLAHAVTNGMLTAYVYGFGQWQYL